MNELKEKKKNQLLLVNQLIELYNSGIINDELVEAEKDFRDAIDEILAGLPASDENKVLYTNLEIAYSRVLNVCKYTFFNHGVNAVDLLNQIDAGTAPVVDENDFPY